MIPRKKIPINPQKFEIKLKQVYKFTQEDNEFYELERLSNERVLECKCKFYLDDEKIGELDGKGKNGQDWPKAFIKSTASELQIVVEYSCSKLFSKYYHFQYTLLFDNDFKNNFLLLKIIRGLHYAPRQFFRRNQFKNRKL